MVKATLAGIATAGELRASLSTRTDKAVRCWMSSAHPQWRTPGCCKTTRSICFNASRFEGRRCVWLALLVDSG